MTRHDEPIPRLGRRRFIQAAGAGTAVVVFGGAQYVLSEELTREARAETRSDGRPRLPPGQYVVKRLRPMGGEPGDPNPAHFRLKVHGLVKRPFEIDFAELLERHEVELSVDVHCVTRWSVLGAKFKGVRIKELAERAKVRDSARYVIFEAAHGYTSNVPIEEALKDNALVAYRLDGRPLPRAHGSPVRAVVPDLYFWKSAKWLTGIRFVHEDERGYWERRGYHHRGDPWRQERYG